MPVCPTSGLNEPVAGASQSSISDQYNIGCDVYAMIFDPMLVDGAAINIGAVERLGIYKRSCQQVARWLKLEGQPWPQATYWGNIDCACTDVIVPTDVVPESDLLLQSKIFALFRMIFEPTTSIASADDYFRTLKNWLRRLRAHPVQIDAEPRELKLMRTFADYVRTSIVGLRKCRVGTA